MTYIDNLSIMRLPALHQAPGLILLVPDFEAVVGGSRHHTRAKIVEIDSQHKVLVAMGEGLEVACHVRIGLTSFHKVQFEMLNDALVYNGRVAVGAGLLDQRRDQVDVVEHIFKADCKVEMRVPILSNRT